MTIRLSAQDRGFTLAGVLVLLAIMSIFLALAVPLWSRVKQRDNEEELIFRGNEFIKAIARYHQKLGIYPPDIETLVKLKYLRHDYLDPMTKSGKWKVLHPDSLIQTGAAGVVNQPGQNSNQNRTGGQTSGTSSGHNKKRDSLSGGDDDDDKDQANKDSGFGSDDDKNKDEEPEVESIGPVVGVVSRSKKESIRIFNGQTHYNKWTFVFALQQQQVRPPIPPGGGGTQGQPGQKGTPPGGTQPGGVQGGGQQGGPRPPSPPPQPQNSGDDDGGGRL